jgi:2-keto-3-deoxy-galactonokinase
VTLLACDWGTTNLRAWVLGRRRAGILPASGSSHSGVGRTAAR